MTANKQHIRDLLDFQVTLPAAAHGVSGKHRVPHYRAFVFSFADADVAVRPDIGASHRRFWRHLARPGGSLRGAERVAIAATARTATAGDRGSFSPSLTDLAIRLMAEPGSVRASHVLTACDAAGEAQTVETIGIVSHLSAIDGFHRALGVDLPTLPEPEPGPPTGEVTPGLKRRRSHIPMPPGPIPVALDLVPAEARMLATLHGPHYMTFEEMDHNDFARVPGLDRAQIEHVSARISLLNKCFY
ncbi:MAG: hypothetical protein R2823_02695 [Acidimicrobiia bacterium]